MHSKRRHGCGPTVAVGIGSAEEFCSPRWGTEFGDAESFGAGFGVRRPLRYLAYKLELTDEQVTELAAILDELKTERAQAAVDQRRSTAALADAIASGSFDEAKAGEAGSARVKTAERLRDAVTRALKRIHGILNEEQRKKFAYLIRAGAISV
jgi:Spy/CpxP family protein refolding chaperone